MKYIYLELLLFHIGITATGRNL